MATPGILNGYLKKKAFILLRNIDIISTEDEGMAWLIYTETRVWSANRIQSKIDISHHHLAPR